jgi:hypothetical protein
MKQAIYRWALARLALTVGQRPPYKTMGRAPVYVET